MPTLYRVFDYTVVSDIALPEALALEGESPARPDVVIRYGALSFDPHASPLIERGGENNIWWYCCPTPTHYLFNTGVADFEIRDGREIVVCPYAGAEEKEVRAFVLGTCFAILQMQGGRVPLHSSAVALNGRAMLLVGNSGAGKSTTTGAFIQQGVPYLADDVSSIVADETGVWVAPAYPQRKLCLDVCPLLGIDPAGLPVVNEERRKVAVRNPAEWHGRRLPLGWIVELRPDEAAAAPTARRIAGRESLELVMHNIFRGRLLRVLGVGPARMKQLLSIASTAGMFRVTRPTGPVETGPLLQLLRGIASEAG